MFGYSRNYSYEIPKELEMESFHVWTKGEDDLNKGSCNIHI